jgi:signal transduction histidine kinase
MKPLQKLSSSGSGTHVRLGDDVRIVSELLTLLALPTAWRGREPREMIEMLLEALEAILPIDLGYATIEAADGTSAEVLRMGRASAEHRLDERRGALRACIPPVHLKTQTLGDRHLGPLRVAASPLMVRARRGALVVGSRVLDFPNETEASILRAATALAAECLSTSIALREREAAERAREDFMATVAHELRHPLGPIVMALDLLKLGSGAEVPKEIAVIAKHVDHLSRLIEDLSNSSRRAHGELRLKTEILELFDVVTDGVEEAAAIINEREHELCVDVPKRGLGIVGDRTRLAGVVANLLTNAAKYTNRGGRIEVTASREETFVMLHVRDDGIGIAPELLPRIFDRFVRGGAQVDGPRHSPSGLGIGLAVVAELISLHGGSVSVQSGANGEGTEFTVCLPAIEGVAATAALQVGIGRYRFRGDTTG